MISLTTETIDYMALTESVRDPHCGAVTLFLGTVRDLTGDVVTTHLDYEAYAPMAEKQLAGVEAEVRQQWPVGGVAIVHRLGRLHVNDISVAIAVSCTHRDQSFAACRYAIDRVKAIVPIWKKDNAPDGTSDWIHPTETHAS